MCVYLTFWQNSVVLFSDLSSVIVGNLGYLLFTLPVVFGGGVLLRIIKSKSHLALQCSNYIGSWHPTFIIGLRRMSLGSPEQNDLTTSVCKPCLSSMSIESVC